MGICLSTCDTLQKEFTLRLHGLNVSAAEQKSSSTIQDVFEVVREQAKQKRLDLPTNVTLNTAQASNSILSFR